MEPDRPSVPAREPLDDAALAAAVREVADDWRMPPQRLDEVTWRDRVGHGRRSGGSGSGRGVTWTRRLVGAAAVAVIATVSLSYLAVWLTGPSQDHGATNPAAPTATPGSGSPAPSASNQAPSPSANGQLPQLAVNGAMPAPSKVMVQTNGRFVLADLTTGVLGKNVDRSPPRARARCWLVPAAAGSASAATGRSSRTVPARPAAHARRRRRVRGLGRAPSPDRVQRHVRPERPEGRAAAARRCQDRGDRGRPVRADRLDEPRRRRRMAGRGGRARPHDAQADQLGRRRRIGERRHGRRQDPDPERPGRVGVAVGRRPCWSRAPGTSRIRTTRPRRPVRITGSRPSPTGASDPTAAGAQPPSRPPARTTPPTAPNSSADSSTTPRTTPSAGERRTGVERVSRHHIDGSLIDSTDLPRQDGEFGVVRRPDR